MGDAQRSSFVRDGPTSGSTRPRKVAWRRALALAGALAVVAIAVVSAVSGLARLRAGLRGRAVDALTARFPGAALSGEVRLEGLLRLVAGPISLPSRTPGAPPLVRIDRITVRPRLSALLGGRFEVGSVALDGVRVEAGARGEGLAEIARALAIRRSRASPGTGASPPRVTFTRAFVHVTPAGAPGTPGMAVGPLAGSAAFGKDGAESTARVSLRLPGDGEGHLRARWGSGDASLEAKLRGLRPASLPEAWRARLPFAQDAGSFELDVAAARLAPVGEARVQALARDLEVRDDRLAPGPVGPVTVRLTGALRWDLGSGDGALEEGRVEIGQSGRATAPLRIAFSSRPEPSFELEVSPSALDWEALAAALPPALAPPPGAPAVRGALSGRLHVSGPARRPEAWRIEGDLDPSGLEPAPRQAGPLDLSKPFTWRGPLPDGGARDVVVGPGNPAFVPIAALPPHVVRAVLASEDAGFYGHHGFDLAEIQDALSRSGEKRLRGASTITQQVAKNLFLSVERTYARKLREALATVALEASVDKRRLLEIYLNVAEWGPGVFGIGEAARHWFGKDARDLSPKEAAFLATVIPNPIRYEMYRRRGALTEKWEERVRDLLVKLRAADVIDDEQLRQAWDAPLTFARGA